jgi:hypothetical protein
VIALLILPLLPIVAPVGQRWAGGSPNQLDWRTQASGLQALGT